MMDIFKKKSYYKRKKKFSENHVGVFKMTTVAPKSYSSTISETDAMKFKKMSWSEIQKTLTKKSAFGKSVIDIYRERK